MNQPSEARRTIIAVQSGKVAGIYAVCINCNKRFTSMRAVSMHLKGTANRHAVVFSNHGNYDKKTGIRINNYAN
ncbi:MAG: hypothetical protein WA364_13795 [Candidatus Nitrosopolaris sp.]